MTPVDELLLFSASTFVVLLVIGRTRAAGSIATILYAGQLLALVKMGVPADTPIPASVALSVLDQPMAWRFDALSWYFALITLGAAFVSSWYASGAWLKVYVDAGSSAGLGASGGTTDDGVLS